jgi:hypothetical protein
MTFVLSPKSEGFYYAINLPLVNDQGASQSFKFEMKFRRVSRSKLNELQRQQEEMAESEVVIDSLERDTDYVLDIAEGWRYVQDAAGEPVEFSRGNVRMLLDNYPNAAGAIVSAFFEATLGGGKRKN